MGELAAPKTNLLGLPLVLFGIFYFLVIRPQSRHAKQHQSFVTSLKKGDEVATQGGIVGTVHAVEDKTVTLDVGGGTKLRVLKNQIAGAWRDGTVTSDAPKPEGK